MSNSAHLSMPFIEAAQSQKHVTHNEAIRALDAIVQLSVLDRDLATPPGSPAEGDRYIVAATATGAWLAKELQIAAWQDGAWAFYPPREGWLAWVKDEDSLITWDGAAWVDALAAAGTISNLDLLGINATAGTTNRLSVSSPASLFSHEGAGHQLKINKNAAGDTASSLYQTGISGRAEMGLTGDDDFHFKVSPDGSAWNEAILIDKDTGEVVLPNTIGAHNLVINGAGVVQQRPDYTLVKDVYGFGPDRFEGMATGTAVTAGTLTSVSNASAGKSGFAHKFSGVTLTGAGILYHRHRIESKLVQPFKNRSATVSVKVYHDAGSAKTFTLFVRKANSADNFSAVTAIGNDAGTSVNSATATTLTFTLADIGDVSNGIELELKMEVGAVTAKNVEITEWQLWSGLAAPDFEYRQITQERMLCQRYFRTYGGNTNARYGAARTTSTGNGELIVVLSPEMRAAPTVTANNITNFVVNDASVAAAVTSLGSTLSFMNTLTQNFNCAAVTAFRPAFIGITNSNALLLIDAEL